MARELGGWQVISWALLLALPVIAPVAAVGLVLHPPEASSFGAWAGLAYVSAISMFAGFVAWYKGLAQGGIARVSQLQLAQPVLTLAWSALLLGEHVGAGTIAAGLAVVGAVALTQRTRHGTTEPHPQRHDNHSDRERPVDHGMGSGPSGKSATETMTN